jgi:hypothetical protein
MRKAVPAGASVLAVFLFIILPTTLPALSDDGFAGWAPIRPEWTAAPRLEVAAAFPSSHQMATSRKGTDHA